MQRIYFLAAFWAAFLLSDYVQAGNVRSVSGAKATVAGHVAHKFQCLVNKLDRAGYKIQFMGGYRANGSVPRSKHPRGLALDINQTGRNIVTRPFPPGTNQMANSCGLFHGKMWGYADTGHFETKEPYMERYYGKRRKNHKKASR